MSLPDAAIACARIVERGDALRFRTVMAAPVQARATLFALTRSTSKCRVRLG
mgnify:CR=1 FL=1